MRVGHSKRKDKFNDEFDNIEAFIGTLRRVTEEANVSPALAAIAHASICGLLVRTVIEKDVNRGEMLVIGAFQSIMKHLGCPAADVDPQKFYDLMKHKAKENMGEVH